MGDVNARQFNFGDWETTEDFDFECPVCGGEGETEEDCQECEGSGTKVCSDCNGDGCDECSGGEITCDECWGDGVVDIPCEECESGWVVPMWNTAWEIELYNIPESTKADILQTTNCTVFADDRGTYYLGLTGCGMDLSPDLCKAWLKLGFGWLPSNWIYKVSRDRKYCEYVAGKEWTDKIYEVAVKTLEYEILDAQRTIKNIKGEQE